MDARNAVQQLQSMTLNDIGALPNMCQMIQAQTAALIDSIQIRSMRYLSDHLGCGTVQQPNQQANQQQLLPNEPQQQNNSVENAESPSGQELS